MGEWSDFAVATAGAAAALAGLLIVAISVNVAQIVKFPHLPARAAAAVGSLVLVLLVAITALAPQSPAAFGLEVLGFGLVSWLLHVQSGRVSLRANRKNVRPLYEAVQVIVLGQVQSLPVLAGAALIVAGVPAGQWALFAGILAIFPLAVLDAWVLLIEILR